MKAIKEKQTPAAAFAYVPYGAMRSFRLAAMTFQKRAPMKRHDVETTSFQGDTSNGFFGSRGRSSALMRVCAWVLASLALLLPALGSAQVLNVKGWQDTIKKTPPAKTGCFVASYPGMQWQPTACSDVGSDLFGQRSIQEKVAPVASETGAIGGSGYSAGVTEGALPIKSAEGSFLSVSGVTDITDSKWGSNHYSLQLNTDQFAIPAGTLSCSSYDPSCKGWVQFVYSNDGDGAGTLGFQYWLIGFSSCADWAPQGSQDCGGQAGSMLIPGGIPLDKLDQVILRGETINGFDIATLFIGGNAYTISDQSYIPNVSQAWKWAQFNIFGWGGYSGVILNNGSSLTVNTRINNGTTDVPFCSGNFLGTGTWIGTGETNNLYYNSPCCAYGGGTPSIAFIEGTTNSFATQSCAPLGDNTITVAAPTPSAGGTISPSVDLHVPNLAVSTFTLTPNPGYKVDSVGGTCGGTLDATNTVYTTAPANRNCTVTPMFTAAQTYSVTASAGKGGAINPSGGVNVISGTTKTFAVAANDGYDLSSVGGTCGGTLNRSPNSGPSTYITNSITANCTVTANFSAQTHILTISAGAGGSITPAGGSTVSAGTNGSITVTTGATPSFTVTPDPGYGIVKVIGSCGGILSGNTFKSNPITYADCTVTATFGTLYTVTLAAGVGGSITPEGGSAVNSGTTGSVPVAAGTIKTFTVAPNSGYVASISGCNGSMVNATTFQTGPITGACTVSATFTAQTYAVTAIAGANGTITPAGGSTVNAGFKDSVPVAYGTTKTFTVAPNTGYVASVSGCNGSMVNATTFQTGTITGPCAVSATFTAQTYTLTAKAGANGTITPAGGSTVNAGSMGSLPVAYGATQTFTVAPNTGYVASVSGCNGSMVNANTFQTGPITGPCTVSATFPQAYTVTVSAGAHGTYTPAGGSTVTAGSTGNVPVGYGTTKTFTVTPATGYMVASVDSTCHVSFANNNYPPSINPVVLTTGVITGDCTVTAAFVPSNYYQVQLAGNDSMTHIKTFSWQSWSTYVPPGSTVTIQMSLYPIYTGYMPIVDVNINTCPIGSMSGTWPDYTYTTGPITANCKLGLGTSNSNVPTYVVTAKAGANGTITPSGGSTVTAGSTGSVSVVSGATQTFTVAPNTGYVASVSGCNGSMVNATTFQTGPITGACTVSATFTPPTYTIAASAGTGGTISPTGSITGVVSGTTKSFTIAPNAGYTIFSPVGGTCGGTLSGTTFTTKAITGNCTVQATFTPVPYTVTASVLSGSGTISPSGASSVAYGATKAFTVTPGTGYTATVAGTCGGTLSGNTYTTKAITGNCTVQATFTKTSTYNVKISANAGTFTPYGTIAVEAGKTVQITGNGPPNISGVQFNGTCGGFATIVGNVLTTKPITSDCTIEFIYSSLVTVSGGTGGTINPAGNLSVTYGATKTFTIAPNAGYSIFSPVGGTCGGTLSGNTYTTKAITASCTVQATFAKTP
jgi:hypothetical protein